ncbi:hypothetical protein GGR52DRAFT_526777 [Hypoxylon sp. FL1284]|nr:hypothetical protein GGR52DRAFT_526777 [Hypoxylon sp. FL1284]
MAPTKWNAEVYQAVALAAWDAAKLTTEQQDNIVEKLNGMGYTTITREGMRQHFQKKLRAEHAAASGSSPSVPAPTAPAPTAPASAATASTALAPSRGRGGARGRGRGRGGSRATKRKAPAHGTEGDDDELDKKRVKKELPAPKTGKKEDDEAKGKNSSSKDKYTKSFFAEDDI